MITAASLTNIETAAAKAFVVGTAGSVSAGGVTLEELDITYETDEQEIPKHQSSGQWENHAQVRRLLITARGKIVGTSASDYIDQRQALVASFLPNEGTPSDRNHTTLALTLSDSTVTSDEVIFRSFTSPISVRDLDSERASTYTLELVNRTGYFHVGGVAVKF